MVDYQRFVLENGLRVLLHEDKTTPLVAVNVLYEVGSRNENPERTGFAHLFEHLMFSGSQNVKDFDEAMQTAGGENNAFTTNDHTSFYEIMPAENLETALWLESDRMLALDVTAKNLQVQRKVVVEEFKETTLNEPYGDSWHHLSDLAYKEHPYRWPVIGLKTEHIEEASIKEVRNFYKKWYCPNNAILSIAGNIDISATFDLVKKWFGDIPAVKMAELNVPQEKTPLKTEVKIVEADVPVTAIYIAFRTPARMEKGFLAVDLLSDVLAQGSSSRLYRKLLKEKGTFSQIDAYLTANIDPGLLIFEGRPAEGVSEETAIAAIWEEIEALKSGPIPQRELDKIRNHLEAACVFAETNILNKAQNLVLYENLGDVALVNTELDQYLAISAEEIHQCALDILDKNKCVTLIYKPKTVST